MIHISQNKTIKNKIIITTCLTSIDLIRELKVKMVIKLAWITNFSTKPFKTTTHRLLVKLLIISIEMLGLWYYRMM